MTPASSIARSRRLPPFPLTGSALLLAFLPACSTPPTTPPANPSATPPPSTSTAPQPALQRFEFEHPQMGTLFRITLYACSLSDAAAAAHAAFRRIDQLNQTLSDYLADSELTRLSNSAGSGLALPVSPDLWNMLDASLNWYHRSDHAFDITIRPVVRLWRRARQNNRYPDPERLAEALALVSSDHLVLDPAARTASLRLPGMSLDLGGIAKGYAADQALAVLKQHGIHRALIAGGGSITLGDSPPDSPGWRVALRPLLSTDTNPTPPPEQGDLVTPADPAAATAAPAATPSPATSSLPQHTLITSNLAVATSGDAFQHVIIDGKRYSHIIDPRSGIGLSPPIAVTVIAPDGTTADALSTAVSILGPDRGLALVESTPGAHAILIRLTDDGILETFTSSRFHELNLDSTPPPAGAN